MRTLWEGKLIGTFFGYKHGRVFDLSDGSRWRQDDLTDKPVYREQPTARLLWNQSLGVHYLDVEGTSVTVIVVPAGGKPKRHGGAF